MNRIIFAVSLLLAFPATLPAAEVINLKVGQSGDKGFATFDLAGKIGEREAEVVVTLTINSEKYSADKLTLTGDFGKKVKTGVGKRIVWDILSDIPTGFDGEVIWNVDTFSGSQAAVGNDPQKSSFPQASSDSPFEFSEQVARDRKTGLLWLRTVSNDATGVDFSKARGVITRLEKEKFAGCSDWKLPLAEDLQKIHLYALANGYKGKKSKGYPADYFNAIGFKGVANDYYWSREFNYVVYGTRITVDFEDGNLLDKSFKDYLQVWPVCKPD